MIEGPSKATIYLIRDCIRSSMCFQLSQHLSEYLDVADLISNIVSILQTPVEALDELFKSILRLPELPRRWLEPRRAENETLTMVGNPHADQTIQGGLSMEKVQEIKHRIDAASLPKKREIIEISDDEEAAPVSNKRPRGNFPAIYFKREIISLSPDPMTVDHMLEDTEEHFIHSPLSSRNSTPQSDIGSLSSFASLNNLAPHASVVPRELSDTPSAINTASHTPSPVPTPSTNQNMRHSMSLHSRQNSEMARSDVSPSPPAHGFGVEDIVRRLRSRPRFTTELEGVFAREYFVNSI